MAVSLIPQLDHSDFSLCLKDIDFDNLPSDLGFYVVNTIYANPDEQAASEDSQEGKGKNKQQQVQEYEDHHSEKQFDEVFSELNEVIQKEQELQEVKDRLQSAEKLLLEKEGQGAELAMLREKVEELQNQLQAADATAIFVSDTHSEEIDGLKERLASLDKELKDKELSIAEREKELSALQRVLVEKEGEIKSIGEKRSEFEALLQQERENKAFEIADERMLFSRQVERLTEELNSLRARNEELEQLCNEKEALLSQKTELAESAEGGAEQASNEELVRLKAEVSEKEQSIKLLQEKVDASTEIVREKERETETRIAELQSAEAKIRELTEGRDKMERRLAEREQEISGASEGVKEELQSLEEEMRAAAKELGQTKLLLEFREKEIEMLKKETKSKMEEDEKELQRLKADLETRNSDVEALSKQLMQLQEEAARAKSVAAEKHDDPRLVELTASLAETQEKLKKSEEERQRFEAANLKAKAVMESELQEKFDRIKQDIDAKMVMAKELRGSLDQKTAEVGELRAALKRKEAELQELKEKTDLELKGCEEVRLQMEAMVVSKTLELQAVLDGNHKRGQGDEFVVLGTDTDKKRIAALEEQLQQLEARKDRRIAELEEMVRDKANKLDGASRVIEKTLKESEERGKGLEEKNSQLLMAKERLEAQLRVAEARRVDEGQKYAEEIKQLEGTIATQVEQVAILKKLLAAMQQK